MKICKACQLLINFEDSNRTKPANATMQDEYITAWNTMYIYALRVYVSYNIFATLEPFS